MAHSPVSVVVLLALGLTQSAAVALWLAAPAAEQEAAAVPPLPAATAPAAGSADARAPETDPVRDILQRPLFHPRRRLDSMNEAPLAPPLAEPAGRLVGVIIGANGREALFLEANSRVTILRQGSILHGWKLETIEPDRVILTSARGQRTMNLVTDRLQAVAPVPAGPAIAVPAGKTLWRPVPAPMPLDSTTSGQPAASGRQIGEQR